MQRIDSTSPFPPSPSSSSNSLIQTKTVMIITVLACAFFGLLAGMYGYQRRGIPGAITYGFTAAAAVLIVAAFIQRKVIPTRISEVPSSSMLTRGNRKHFRQPDLQGSNIPPDSPRNESKPLDHQTDNSGSDFSMNEFDSDPEPASNKQPLQERRQPPAKQEGWINFFS